MAKRVLGRGLGAYFPEHSSDQAPKKENTGQFSNRVDVTIHIPVTHIRENPNQPRKDFDEFRLQELSDSIRQHGLIQPITVRRVSEDRYELISGERRLRATKMAGIDTIPAYVRDATDEQSIAFALIENVQREELNPIEVALGYQQLVEECSYTQEEVARKVGKNRTTVTNMLRLLHLPPTIQAALQKKNITTGHARALVSVENKQIQEKLLDKTISEDWSVRQIEEAVRNISEKKTSNKTLPKKKDAKDVQLIEISNRLRNKLSTKVQIKKKSKGGEIRIEYFSDDELERLLNLLENIS